MKDKLLAIIEEYGDKVDGQGWEIEYRFTTVNKIITLLKDKMLEQKVSRRFVVEAQDGGHWVEPSYSEEIKNKTIDDCMKALNI